ncbi:MAG: DEAD/DEAH box helicase [Euryarchaeota archaeon]|nr:DEAD/DEAH box helicase [Euryarchaeota archaeon]
MKFEDFSLEKKTLEAVDALGYETPTPVQERVIPVALSGRDVVGQSCTGSGKTAAFSIPFAEKVDAGRGLQALVLAPTRELCLQITRDVEDMTRNRGVKVVPVYGGQSIEIQLNKLGRADIVIATPGRLLDHLRRRSINLGGIKILVLDEADRMLDMGFIDDIRRIIRATPKDRQTMLFSATIPRPILRLSQKYMRDPEVVEITAEMDKPDIDEVFIQVEEGEKFQMLMYILDMEVPESAMIFCNTKHLTDTLAENLKHQGYEARAIHGDLKQSKREKVIRGFYEKKYPILVATDVASRGLDIDDVSHIINYDVPQDAEDYTHRIGRTARMGKKGKAITLLSPSGHQDMRNFEKFHGYVEFTEIKGFNPEMYAPLNPKLRGKDRIRNSKKKGRRGRPRGRGFRGRPPRGRAYRR